MAIQTGTKPDGGSDNLSDLIDRLMECQCAIDDLRQTIAARYTAGSAVSIADDDSSPRDEQRLRSAAERVRIPETQPLISVVVPAYNEAATLALIVARLLNAVEEAEIIIVDDCSTDGTAQIADRLAIGQPRIKVVHHEANAGKTAALRTGFRLTTGKIVIVQDADLEYDPVEIDDMVAPIVEGHADVVFGSRFLVRKASRVLYFRHYIGNQLLTFLSNLCTNTNMTDVETCYKAFRGEIIRNMTIASSGFGFEIEVAAKMAKLGAVIYEVPISYYGRTYEEGKKIGPKDFVLALLYIFRFNFLCSLENSFPILPTLERAQLFRSHRLSRE